MSDHWKVGVLPGYAWSPHLQTRSIGLHRRYCFTTLSNFENYSSSRGQQVDPAKGFKTPAVLLAGCRDHLLHHQIAE